MPESKSITEPQQFCVHCHFLTGMVIPNTLAAVIPSLGGLSSAPPLESLSAEDRLVFERYSAMPIDPALSKEVDINNRVLALEPTTTRIKALVCAQGIWREHQPQLGRVKAEVRLDVVDEISRVNRKNACYFFPYQEGVLVETARDLWRREYDTAKEIAARDLETRKEARDLVMYEEQTKRESLVQAREDKKYLEDREFAKSQKESAQNNLKWARIITIVTAIAALATVAQAIAAFLKSPTP